MQQTQPVPEEQAAAEERAALDHAKALDFVKAASCFKRALKIRADLGQNLEEALNRFQLAVALEHSQGKPRDVVMHYKKALMLFEWVGRADWQGRTLKRLIPYLSREGRRQEAQRFVDRLALLEGNVPGSAMDALRLRLGTLRDQGDQAGVLRAMEQALAAGIVEKGSVDYQNLRFFHRMFDKVELDEMLAQAQSSNNRPLIGYLTLERAADRIGQGKFAEALPGYREVCVMAKELGDPVLCTFGALGCIMCLDALNRRDEALSMLLDTATYMGEHFGREAKDAFFPIYNILSTTWGVAEFERLVNDYRARQSQKPQQGAGIS